MTAAAIKRPPQLEAGVGWVDGFCSAPIEAAGHIAVRVTSGLYVLIWPAAAQGGISAVSQRLLQVGRHAHVIPAQNGQKITSTAAAQQNAEPLAERLMALLQRFGRAYQFTLVFPLEAAAPHAEAVDLRAKHAALQVRKAALKAANDSVQPLISPLKKHSLEMRPLVPIAADKAGLHVLVRKSAALRFEKGFAKAILPHHMAALIGPMPPFVFLEDAGLEHPKR